MSKSKRKSRHKNRRMRELAEIQRQARAFGSGATLARRLMLKADAGVESLGLRKELAPVIAIFSLTLAQTYSKKPADKEKFASALPFAAAEAFNRMVYEDITLEWFGTTPTIEDACHVHDLLHEAKRWHEEP